MPRVLIYLGCLVVAVWSQADSDILKPPKVILPKGPVTRYESKDTRVIVECKAEGNPPPIYRWHFNDSLIRLSDPYYSYDSTTGELEIKELTRRENGMYRCEAMNRLEAASLSPPIYVYAQDIGNFINPVPTTTTASENGYAQLKCNYNGNAVSRTINYKWYHTLEQDQIDLEGGRLYVDTMGNLHFTYVKETGPASTSKTYRCGLSSENSNIIVLGPSQGLTVQPSSIVMGTRPSLAYSNSGVKVRLFSTVILECFFSAYDPSGLPTITWQDTTYKEIRNNDKYTISMNGRRLTIQSVQVIDEGVYHCKGTNSLGSTDMQPVELDVISSPVWATNGDLRDKTISQGEDAVFPCNAYSLEGESPAERPVWLVNAKPYSGLSAQDKAKFTLSPDGKIMTIKNVQKATDNICVQCSVKNEDGITYGDACLTVIMPISVIRQPEKLFQVIDYGDIVDLTVIAETDPSITSLVYSWVFKNETYMDAPPYVTYNPDNKQAFINTSRLTQEEYLSIEGIYLRKISHMSDSKSVFISVVIDDKPAAVRSGSTFDWWIIGLIISILCLIIVVVLIVFLCYRKAQEGDYNVDKKENGAGLDPEKELKQKHFDDFSPPAYTDYDFPAHDKKPQGQAELEYDDVPIGGDDESLAEYGSEDLRYFNDDGSFIGEYQTKAPPRSRPHATESTI